MKVNTLSPNSKIPLLILSLFYSLVLCYLDLLFDYSFGSIKDRVNYQNYFDLGIQALYGRDSLDFVFSEPVFLFFMTVLSTLFESSVGAVRALIAVSSFLFSYSVLKLNRVSWGVKFLVLLFPWVLVNFIMTLRQGLALSMFLYAYFHGSKKVKIIVYSLVPLIHYAFWLVVGFLSFRILVKKVRISPGLVVFLILTLAFFLLVFISFSLVNSSFFPEGELRNLLARYYGVLGFQLGFGWIFWFLVCLTIASQRISYIRDNYLVFSFLVLYLILSPFIPPVSRVMQIAAPLILLSALAKIGISGVRRIILVGMVIFHICYFIIVSIESGGPGGMMS